MAKIVYRAACWDCNDFHIGKTKRRLHDRKTEHFKALINGHHTSALADHVTSTGHYLRWDHFEVLAKGRPTLTVKPGFHIVVSVVSVVSVVRKKFIGQIEFILSRTKSCICRFFCIEHLYGRFP